MHQPDAPTVVLGAGMIGTAIARELATRGHAVTLIDRKAPGEETSFGNAGVIARESVVPLNNPGLWRALPKYLLNRSAKLRYRPGYLLANARWTMAFLANARRRPTETTIAALDQLLDLSRRTHIAWLREAGQTHRLREQGWLTLHRSAGSHAAARSELDLYQCLGLNAELLDANALHDLEPHIAPSFTGALWRKDAATVDNPGAVVKAYAADAVARGAVLRQASIRRIARRDAGREPGRETGLETGLEITLDGETLAARRVVVAMGAWSRDLLKGLGLDARLANERGYHMHYGARGNATLTRAFHDAEGGYALAPMETGLRLTTGVELAPTDAPPNPAQLTLAEAAARRAFPLAERRDETPWMGRRPTTPDSRPVIGAAARVPGLWLAYGHQHIGFSTGPGTARLIADLIEGIRPEIDPAPFSPARFRL